MAGRPLKGPRNKEGPLRDGRTKKIVSATLAVPKLLTGAAK